MGGLHMGQSAGPYQRSSSRERGVYLAEHAFFFVEGSVLRHSPRYRNYGHWGITEIHRKEWNLILRDLVLIAERASKTLTPEDFREVTGISERLEGLICGSFPASRDSLAEMLDDLSEWVREALLTIECVCVLGI